jgi:osmotically-inducible protein OsmY
VTLEDGRISAAVRTVLLNDPELGLRRITVEVRMGVVTLSGAVRTLEEVQRAERLARSVAGVRELKSVLRIEP